MKGKSKICLPNGSFLNKERLALAKTHFFFSANKMTLIICHLAKLISDNKGCQDLRQTE